MNFKKVGFLPILVWILVTVILSSSLAAAQAQSGPSPAAPIVKPTLQLKIPPPQVRAWKEMEAATLKAIGPAPAAPEIIPFRPTIGEEAYQALKTQADRTRALQAPSAPGVESAVPLAPAAVTNPINFPGVDSATAGSFFPPDTHGAVGPNHFLEITNSHIDIYEKAAPNTRVGSVTLSSFFAYTTRTLFDPRAIFDPDSQRWIVSADARAESATVQRFFFAVSQTADPLGNFYVYNVNVSNGSGVINGVQWDFPQLGMDRNAIIFTANFFTSTGTFIDARMFAVAKSLLYNGPSQTLTPSLFTGLAGTLAPPIVLDINPNTYLVAADSADNKVTLYTLTNSAANPPTLNGPGVIPVPAYAPPPNAPQPGTTYLLDTSDSRFVNASTQIGNSLFQIHAINSGGFSRCRFYEFDPVGLTVRQSGTFGRSSTSYDFNASIAANRFRDLFVTWSATDTGVNAEVRFSGRLHTDPPGVIPSGSLLFGSATFYRDPVNPPAPPGGQRWGDYSAVSLDPADPRGCTAWIVNETILANTSWGSQIGSIGLPPFNSSLPAAYLLLLLD